MDRWQKRDGYHIKKKRKSVAPIEMFKDIAIGQGLTIDEGEPVQKTLQQ